MYLIHRYKRTVVHRPNDGLGAVLDPDFTKDRLDMNLHGGLGNVDLARDELVGTTCDQIGHNTRFLNR